MYICRLFDRSRPEDQLDVRLFAGGSMSIGRDPSADWQVDDATGAVSRLHCVLATEAGGLVLYDKSTNGVFLGDQRVAPDTPVPLVDKTVLRLGGLLLEVGSVAEAPVNTTATLFTPAQADPTPLPETWVDGEAAPQPARHRDGSLLEAFCAGAKLDASVLSSEDPEDLMHRIGAIYQQTVIGLAALMADRASIKSDNHLQRTTISALGNNPFKWAASRKLAEDLLCNHSSAFLSDAAAVRACFTDLSLHLAGVMAGAEAAVAVMTETLDPKAIESEAKAQATLLRSRTVVAWDLLTDRHAELCSAPNNQTGPLRTAFAKAYTAVADPG